MATRIDLNGVDSLLCMEERDEVKAKITASSDAWITVTEQPRKNPSEARDVDVRIDQIVTLREAQGSSHSLHNEVPAIIGGKR